MQKILPSAGSTCKTPGAKELKLKEVLDSGKFYKNKTMLGPGEPLKNKSVLGDRKINTVRVFDIDIDKIYNYLTEIKKHAYGIGYVERRGRGNKGPQLSFTCALHYKLKDLTPEDAAREFMKERNSKN